GRTHRGDRASGSWSDSWASGRGEQLRLPVFHDSQAIDLVGAFEDARQAHVAQRALDAVAVEAAMLGEQIHGHLADLLRTVGRLELARRRVQLAGLPGAPGLVPDHAAQRTGLRQHGGELQLHLLVVNERPAAELIAAGELYRRLG